MKEKIDVICAGILVADILASPIEKVPEPGQLVFTEEIFLFGGGHAHNTSVSLARLGVRVAAMGKVGRDTFGDFLKKDLEKEGVDISKITISDKFETSKTIIILTPSEDRRFIYTPGANADFSIDDIDFGYISQAKLLYLGGYGVLSKLDEDSLARLLKFAKKRGLVTVLDVVIPSGEINWINRCKKALEFTDFFLPNTDEARIITGQVDPGKQAEEILKYNSEMTVVITMGKEGSLVRTKDRIVQASAYKIKTIDSSGGGDAFTAGFIFGIMSDWELEKIVKFASAMGASAGRKMGCTTGVFTREEVYEFIRNNKIKVEKRESCKP